MSRYFVVSLLFAFLNAIPATGFAEQTQITQGLVVGERQEMVIRYLGIPYAQAPVGALRWQPPREPKSWKGVRQARSFGSACAQVGNYFASNDPITFGKPYGSEDCLTMNVWHPVRARENRPVLVFIHGGAGIFGAASLPAYGGERLARELDAVVMSFNYRLGFFGNIQIPALQTEDPASRPGLFGLLDQIQALSWVRENAAAFGGDAANVTVMGHSAGCVSLWALVRSPLAKGKFDRMICLSGLRMDGEQAKLDERRDQFLGRLFKADGSIASQDALSAFLTKTTSGALRHKLYGMSSDAIIEAGRDIRAQPGVSDGHVLSKKLLHPVPAIIGTTANEASMLLYRRFSKASMLDLWRQINSDWSGLQAHELFPGRFAYLKFRLVSAVMNFRMLGRVDEGAGVLTKQVQPVYRYRFEWDQMPTPWREVFGAYHGLDVPFVFGNFMLQSPSFNFFSWGATDINELEAIHAQMVSGMRGFIERGDPNYYPAAGDWPRWNEKEQRLIIR